MSPALIHLRWRAKLVKLEISMLVSQGCENCWQNLERMIEHYLGIILGIGWHFPHPSPWCTLSQIKSQDLHNNVDMCSSPCTVPTFCGIWTRKCELPWFCAEDFVYNLPMLWTSQHSGSCRTISAPNITHFPPHWEWRNTPGRELLTKLHSLRCVCAKCHFHSHCRFLPICWWCEPRNFTQVISPDASTACHIGEIFSLFVDAMSVGQSVIVLDFASTELVTFHKKIVYLTFPQLVSYAGLFSCWQISRWHWALLTVEQQGAPVAVAPSLSQQHNFKSISSSAAASPPFRPCRD